MSKTASSGKFFDAVDVPLIEMLSVLIRRAFTWVDPLTMGKVYRDPLYLALLTPPNRAVWSQRLKAGELMVPASANAWVKEVEDAFPYPRLNVSSRH